MTKADTLKLQRAINAEFGWGLREDGVYGPKTAEAYQYYLDQKTPRKVPTPAPGDIEISAFYFLAEAD